MLPKFSCYSPEVRDFGTLNTSTNVFRLIILKSVDHAHSIGDPLLNLDLLPKQLQAHNQV